MLALSLLTLPIHVRAQRRSWFDRLPARRATHRLTDDDVTTRAAAAHFLGRRGARETAIGALQTALGRERTGSAAEAMLEGLARRPDPRNVSALVAALAGGTERERSIAARGLAAIQDASALDALIAGLQEADRGQAALVGLERAGVVAAPRLISALGRDGTPSRVAEALAPLALNAEVAARVRTALRQATQARAASTRAAALIALAPAANPGDEARYIRALEDESPDVVMAALTGLARIATARAWPALTAALEGAGDGDRPAVLRAMLKSDSSAAAARLRQLAASQNPVEHAQALDAAIYASGSIFLDLYGRAYEAGEQRAEVAAVLVALPDAAGLPILLRAGTPDAARELAVALRASVPHATRVAALARIASQPADQAFMLRALAKDDSILPSIRDALRHEAPLTRVRAAQAAGLLGDPHALPWLGAALAQESSRVAFRALARAMVDLGGGVPAERLGRWLDEDGTAPEAMALGALSARAHFDRGFRRRLRVALRVGPPRTRAGAARALALLADTRARPALMAALDDPRPEVRLAVASALRALGDDPTPQGLMRLATAEPEQAVYTRLAEIPGAAARPFDARGDAVLRVRLVQQVDAPRGSLAADVLLADGRWLRVAADERGELLVATLVAGAADVRPQLALPQIEAQ